jgi:hypothetical protein
MNSNLKTLSEKIQTLSAEQITEVEDFEEFLRYRRQDRELARAAATVSSPALEAIWNNPEDDVYDAVSHPQEARRSRHLRSGGAPPSDRGCVGLEVTAEILCSCVQPSPFDKLRAGSSGLALSFSAAVQPRHKCTMCHTASAAKLICLGLNSFFMSCSLSPFPG